jgi:hypothetical protein
MNAIPGGKRDSEMFTYRGLFGRSHKTTKTRAGIAATALTFLQEVMLAIGTPLTRKKGLPFRYATSQQTPRMRG